MKVFNFFSIIVVASAFSASGVAANCGAQVRANPVTSHEEKVWPVHDGLDFEIHWAEKIAGQWANEVVLSANNVDDSCPSLAIDALSGASAVTWKSGSSPATIHYRARKNDVGSWSWQSTSLQISDGVQHASLPWVTFHGGTPHVVWREDALLGADVVSAMGESGNEPWPTGFTRELMGSSIASGNVMADANSEQDELWTTWLSDPLTLSYREYDATADSWSAEHTVDVTLGDVLAAKAEARSQVLQ